VGLAGIALPSET